MQDVQYSPAARKLLIRLDDSLTVYNNCYVITLLCLHIGLAASMQCISVSLRLLFGVAKTYAVRKRKMQPCIWSVDIIECKKKYTKNEIILNGNKVSIIGFYHRGGRITILYF